MARKAKSVDQTDTSSTSSTSPTDIGPTLQAAGTAAPDLQAAGTAAPDLQAAPGTAPDPQAAPTGGAAPLTLAGQFMRLFKGADRSSGTHNPNVKAAPGKVKVEIKGKGGARTVKEPVTEALWQAHLDGKRPLGVGPVDTAWIVKSLHDLGGKGDQTVWGSREKPQVLGTAV